MNRWWQPRSVRVRLALWYAGATMVVLGVYAAGVFAFVSRSASKALDDRLRGDFQWAQEMADQKPDGSLSWFASSTDDTDSPWLQVWDPDGTLLYRSPHAEWQPLPGSAAMAVRSDGRTESILTGTVPFRVLRGPSTIVGRRLLLQVARSEEPLRQELRQLMLIFVLGLPLGVAVAGLGGYTLARRALAPVDQMTERARSITAERLSERLPADNPNDELGRLASVFNQMLGRLERSFVQMRQFTADVSHELRTPLTVIRSVGEVGLRERRDGQAYRGIIGSMLEEVDRLSGLVERLLALSRVETGQDKLSIELIDLSELAEEVAGNLGVLAEEKRQTLTVERLGTPRAMADRVVLRQAVMNIVDNAIKYTPADGRITIRAWESATGAILDVCDTGPGIAAEPRTRIFDRYYRVARSRAGDLTGAGLGLAIARSAVEMNGGQLSLEHATEGSTFRITLPRASGARPQRAVG